jgi:hypothetical protein
MFRLQKGGRPPSREPGTWRGKKSLTFDVNTALRFHSTHQATVSAIGGRMFFKPLTYLGPGPQAGRSHPHGSQQGHVSLRIRLIILRLAGYNTLVGTGPSSRR